MPTKTTCLTIPGLTNQIEEILQDYPEYSRKIDLSRPKIRQELLDHILEQLPHCYLSESSGTMCCSLEEQIQLNTAIRKSIFQMAREEPEAQGSHSPASTGAPAQEDSASEPSHWFG